MNDYQFIFALLSSLILPYVTPLAYQYCQYIIYIMATRKKNMERLRFYLNNIYGEHLEQFHNLDLQKIKSKEMGSNTRLQDLLRSLE